MTGSRRVINHPAAATELPNMSRYRGRQSAKAVEQDYPHHVDMSVPLGGLGSRLNAMYEWHDLYGITPQCGHGRHDTNGGVIRWCFADPDLAKQFAREFLLQTD
jgi:hypothetical protein